MASLIGNQQEQLRMLTANLMEMKERLDRIDSDLDTGTHLPTAHVSDMLLSF